jgi:transposase
MNELLVVDQLPTDHTYQEPWMPVYLTALIPANCASSGCLCHDRVRSYPSDLTDPQWNVLRPSAEQVMTELRQAQGRPMVHDLRATLDALNYVVRNGIEWRAMPVDFPPWDAVYAFYERWNRRGMPRLLADRLRAQIRVGMGRDAEPTAAVMDSQTVKAADTVGAATRGFDSGKKINGRKRHLAVDTQGLTLAVVVTAAKVADRMGAKLLLIALLNVFTTIKLVWADSGYSGKPLAGWFRAVAAVTLEVIKRTELHTFKVVPRRWVVERTFGWLLRYRRLVRDYERRPEHHEAMVYWASVMIMTKRLARMAGGEPEPPQRWGKPRPAPPQAAPA